MVYQPLFASFSFVTAAGIFENLGSVSVFSFDSKAMRKVGLDDDLVGIFENNDANFGAEAFISGRTLIQLH